MRIKIQFDLIVEIKNFHFFFFFLGQRSILYMASGKVTLTIEIRHKVGLE